jgi:5'-nucleotidase
MHTKLLFYGNDAHMHKNPRGEEHYWIGLHPLEWRDSKDEQISDLEAVDQNFISVTPIMLDLTSYNDLESLKSWI